MFPILKSETRKDKMKECDYVMGEVYAVPPKRLLHIDKTEDNGYMFQREEKHVYLPDQTFPGRNGTMKPSIKAWVYMGTDFFENFDELDDVGLTEMGKRRYINWMSETEDYMWEHDIPNQGSWMEEMNEDFVMKNGKIPF